MGGCSLDLEVGIYLSWSSYSIMNPVELWNGLEIFRYVIRDFLEGSRPINHYSAFV